MFQLANQRSRRDNAVEAEGTNLARAGVRGESDDALAIVLFSVGEGVLRVADQENVSATVDVRHLVNLGGAVGDCECVAFHVFYSFC